MKLYSIRELLGEMQAWGNHYSKWADVFDEDDIKKTESNRCQKMSKILIDAVNKLDRHID